MSTQVKQRSWIAADENASGIRIATAEARLRAVERVVSVIHERFREPLSMATLGRAAMFSPFHMDRFFREITGVSPGRFLTAVRISEAKRLLVTTHYKVTSICYEVGYNSVGTFTRQFTEYVGVQPTRFRKCATAVCEHWNVSPEVRMHTLRAPARAASPDPSRSLHVMVTAAGSFEGAVIVGAFPTAIPRGAPLACGVGVCGEPIVLVGLPEGSFYLFALGIASNCNPADILIANRCPRGRAGPVERPTAKRDTPIACVLRGPRSTDPPIMLAAPFILALSVDLRTML